VTIYVSFLILFIRTDQGEIHYV